MLGKFRPSGPQGPPLCHEEATSSSDRPGLCAVSAWLFWFDPKTTAWFVNSVSGSSLARCTKS